MEAQRAILKQYHEKAAAFIEALPDKARRSLPVLTRESPTFHAWHEYFERHLGAVPVVMRWVIAGTHKHVTVPAEFPSWFDSSFVETPGWQPKQRDIQKVTPQYMRESLEQLKARHGPNWGIRQMTDPPRKKKWTAPTDDELRAYYSKPTSDAAE